MPPNVAKIEENIKKVLKVMLWTLWIVVWFLLGFCKEDPTMLITIFAPFFNFIKSLFDIVMALFIIWALAPIIAFCGAVVLFFKIFW